MVGLVPHKGYALGGWPSQVQMAHLAASFAEKSPCFWGGGGDFEIAVLPRFQSVNVFGTLSLGR